MSTAISQGKLEQTLRYKNHRFPGEIISHGVWLYYRFNLSYRDVQEFLLERGIEVSHESIRKWCGKFEQDYANRLRRRRPGPVTNGTWTRSLSLSTASGITCGEP
jgi:transposase-like protein